MLRRALTLFAASVLVLFGLMASSATAEPHLGNPGGNCDVGAAKVNAEDAPPPDGTVVQVSDSDGNLHDVRVVIDGTGVQFYDANGDPVTVDFCIKASNTNSGTLNGDSGTVDFANNGNQFPDISNVVVYLVHPNEDPGQWCSPGFWKNNPGAVAQTGVDMGQSYNALPHPDVNGTRKGGAANPTLQQVLDSPNLYGGEAFNNVADLLSAEHGGVDFQGERVADSCPLSADEASKS